MRPFFEHVVESLRTSAASRGSDVRQVRSETRAALVQHRRVRRAIGSAMRQALQQHRAAVIGSLRSALAPVLPSRSSPPEAGLRADGKVPAAEQVGVWELWPGTPEEEAAADARLQHDVLRVIERHPEGVRAVGIGNELGIDWRRVIGITHALVEGGKVEQVEQEFYPVRKASRRW